MRELIIGLVIGASAVAGAQNLDAVLTNPIATIDDTTNVLDTSALGRVFAACVPDVRTDGELIAWLRGISHRGDGLVGIVGYVGDDGDAYALTEAMLRSPRPSTR